MIELKFCFGKQRLTLLIVLADLRMMILGDERYRHRLAYMVVQVSKTILYAVLNFVSFTIYNFVTTQNFTGLLPFLK